MPDSSASPVGVPLRDRIAATIHDANCGCEWFPDGCGNGWPERDMANRAADAVVALLREEGSCLT